MPLLRKKEAASILRCSVVTLDRLRKAGKLAFVKVGKAILFREEDVNRFIETVLVKEKGAHHA